MIGKEAPPHVLEVEKGVIKKFAQAIDDPNPLWQDEEYARQSSYGGIIAPPSLLCSTEAGSTGRIELELPLKRAMAGGDEIEFFLPVRAGDVITCNQRVVELREKETKKGGKMIFTVFENVFTNQKGEVVAKGWVTHMNY